MLALATWLAVRRETDLGDGKRADYKRHAFEGNLWIEARKRESVSYTHLTLPTIYSV